MHRLSRLFWITSVGGVVASLLLLRVLWMISAARYAEVIALCGQGKEGCSGEALEHVYRLVRTAWVGSTLLLFWLAYGIGRMVLKTPPLPVVEGE